MSRFIQTTIGRIIHSVEKGNEHNRNGEVDKLKLVDGDIHKGESIWVPTQEEVRATDWLYLVGDE